ncbi:hypothetical protein Vadar_024571 [Vaccinium darrowii]|uniref:Uncharacterized protein n=1 Tax=Vaccinium darrowii TaxID=229202 RepID=A0ACB7X3K7_9ERIC|nr:hypothetical protein Vadar_024571 [Vaccinium darrowii]
MEELILTQAMNLVFTGGPYNGSSLTVLGSNPVMHPNREMPVIGGSGVFRLAHGDFKIQNIVGSCDVKFPIRLEGLAYSHGAFSSYEPELFPGLIYRMKQPKIVLLVMTENNVYLNNVDLNNNLRELTGPGTQNR